MATEHVTVMLMVALMALSAPSHCQAMHYSQHRGRQTLGTEAQHSVFGRGLKSLGNWLAWFNEEYPETGSGGDMPSPFQDLLPHSDGDSDRDSGPFGNSPPAGDPMQMPAPTTTPPAPAYPPPAPATDGPTTAPPPADGGSKQGAGSCDDPMVAEMIAMHNEYRSNGPLTCNTGGGMECMKWSEQMCSMRTLSHDGAELNAEAAGFTSAWGENVLYNYGGMDGTVERGFEQWRTSPGHEENMSGDFEGVGCGWYLCDDDRIYWTCIYGSGASNGGAGDMKDVEPTPEIVPVHPEHEEEAPEPDMSPPVHFRDAPEEDTVRDEENVQYVEHGSHENYPMKQSEPATPPAARTDGTSGGGSCDDPVVAGMLALHNDYRASNGVSPPFTCNSPGGVASMEWAGDFCASDVSHDGADARAAAAGFTGEWAESVVGTIWGMEGTAEAAFDMWISDAHRDAIVDAKFDALACGWYACNEERINWICVYGN